MNIMLLLLQRELPVELSCHLIYFLEKRVPYKRYSLGELKRRLLICAVCIVRHYGWITTREFKELVKAFVEVLADLYACQTKKPTFSNMIKSRDTLLYYYPEKAAEVPP
jgi:hypothetical protein